GSRGPGGGVLCPGGMGSFSLVVEVVARGSGRPGPVVPGCHVGAVWGQVGMGAWEVGHLQGTGDVSGRDQADDVVVLVDDDGAAIGAAGHAGQEFGQLVGRAGRRDLLRRTGNVGQAERGTLL